MLKVALISVVVLQLASGWRYGRNKGILPNPYTYSGIEFTATSGDQADSGVNAGHSLSMSMSGGTVDIFGTSVGNIQCLDSGVCFESSTGDPDTSPVVVAPNWLPEDSSLYEYILFMQAVVRTTDPSVNPGPNTHYLDFVEEIVQRSTYPLTESTAWSCDEMLVVTWRITSRTNSAVEDIFQVVFADGTAGGVDTDFVLMMYEKLTIERYSPQLPRGYINNARTPSYAAICGASAANPASDLAMMSNYYCAEEGHFVFQTSGADGLGSAQLNSICSGSDPVNIALGKPATQSSASVTSPGPATAAVDGIFSTSVSQCTHTDETSPATSQSWTLDLLGTYTITAVRVLNSAENGEWLQNIDIFVTDRYNFISLCHNFVGPGQDGKFYTFTCPQPLSGGTVTIVRQEPGVLALCEVQVYGEVNLALDRPATQSSDLVFTSLSGPAARAVDGIADSNFNHGSCTHTDSTDTTNTQWWQVELDSTYTVNRVRILNRGDASGSLLANTDIYVGPSPTSLRLCYHFPGPATLGVFYTLTCNQPTAGRYVLIAKRDVGVLNICEVEVYGIVNRALNKPASQSSAPVGSPGFPDDAVDGNPSITCAITGSASMSWWQVDLQGQYTIGQVRVYNRPLGSAGNQLEKTDILVGADATSLQLCHHFHGPAEDGLVYTFTCTEPVAGRYVRIERNTPGVLTLCEVEVYEEGGGSVVTDYQQTYPNRNYVRAQAPTGHSCTESVYCEIDRTTGNRVLMNFWLKMYQGDTLQFLDYDSDIPVTDPGCVTSLPPGTNGHTTQQSLTFDPSSTTNADIDAKCGMKLNPVAKTVKWKYHVYRDYDMDTGAGNTLNSMYTAEHDDLTVYGTCHQLVHAISQTPRLGDIDVTEVPPRTRSVTLKFVADGNSNLPPLTSAAVGANVSVSICFDPGTQYNENADDYGVYVEDGWMSNNPGFINQQTGTNRAVQVISGGCGTITGNDMAFHFFKSFEKDTVYDSDNLQFGNPFCITAGPFFAARWSINPLSPNTYNIHMRCRVKFCHDTTQYGTSKCKDSCSTDRRRKRSAVDASGEEMVEAVIEITEPEFVTPPTDGATMADGGTCISMTTTIATLGSLAAAIFVATAYTLVAFFKYQNLRRKLKI